MPHAATPFTLSTPRHAAQAPRFTPTYAYAMPRYASADDAAIATPLRHAAAIAAAMPCRHHFHLPMLR